MAANRKRQRLPAGVTEQRPGYYQAAVSRNGRRVTRSGTDPVALGVWYAAEKRRSARAADAYAGGRRDRTPFRDHLAAWLDGKRGTVGARHWGNHERHAATLALYLGDLALGDLVADDFRRLYARLQAAPDRDAIGRGLAAKTIREIHGTARQALQQAVRDRILERNEAEYVEPPKQAKRTKQRVLSSTELAAFWRTAAGDRLAGLWVLAGVFPSRAGELRAVRWRDLDEAAGVLAIVRSVEATADAGRVLRTKAPKTAAGLRDVELDAETLAALRRHRAVQAAERLQAGARWVDHGLIFTTRYGTPLDGGNIRRRFRWLLARAGIPDPKGVRFHDLRHTAVSALLAAHVPDAEVAALAGHANPNITRTLYNHRMKRRTNALGEARAFHRAQTDGDGGETPATAV